LRAARASRRAPRSTGAREHNLGGDRAAGGSVAQRRHCAAKRPRTRECPRRDTQRSARGNHRLGSADTISTSSGQTFEQRFDPFGAPSPANSDITRSGYTGHQHDDDLGLIDMNGRVYDPLAARFLTADPIMQAPHWSQGMNRYAYVFNDPINATDPSGFISMSDVVGGFVAAGHFAAVGLAAYGFGTPAASTAMPNAAMSLESTTRMLPSLQGQPGSSGTLENPTSGGPSLGTGLQQRPPGTSLFDPEAGALACGDATSPFTSTRCSFWSMSVW
jgi:RHS repeat-associated protein